MAAPRDTSVDIRSRRLRLIWLLTALAVWNVVINLAVPSPAYVPANLVAAGMLLAAARRWGHTNAELGTERRRVRTGIVVGLAVAAVVCLGVVALAAWPWSRRFYADDTLTDLAFAGMLYQTVFRIPLGTAVLEEVAFRGVLFAQWRRIATTGTAVVGTSAAFGLWHILPTLGRLGLNPAGGYAVNGIAEVGIVTAAVLTTGLAGVVFAMVRVRSESLVAPLVAHAVINSTAFAVGWLVAG